MSETVVLDPTEEATGRTQVDITDFIGPEGPDWGDATVEMYMVKLHMGSIPVDHDVPLRQIVIPLLLQGWAGKSFEQIRSEIQAKAALFQQEGGWLKRTTAIGPVFADVVNASLKLGGDTLAALGLVDSNAALTLETLPDFYEPEEELDDIETFQAELVSLLKKDGLPAVIRGDYPARCRLVVDNDSSFRQLGLIYALRSKHYSPDALAQLAYSAREMLPLDQAAASTNAITHLDLAADWTPVLATDLLPTVRSVGTPASGTGNVTPGTPAGSVANDIWLIFVETANETVPVPAGYAHVADSPVSVAAGGVTRLSVLWKRVADGETAPTITDPGDHCVAQIVAVKNCIETGNPWDVTSPATEAIVDGSASIPGDTTAVDGCLVLAAVATGADVASTAQASAFANADLQALTERLDNWVTGGNGGGFAMASGVKPKAGAYAATTCTLATAAEKAMLSIALKPKAGGNKLTHTGTYRVWALVTSDQGVEVRLVWDVGDLVQPVENRKKRTITNGGPVVWLADLGEVRLDPPPVGDHRWQGVIQAKGDVGGENITVEKVYAIPVDEGYGVLRTPLNADRGLVAFSARDEFNQSAGNLDTKALPVGGTWTEEGDTGNFAVVSGGLVRRTTVSDPAHGRRARASGPSLAALVAQVDFRRTAIPAGGGCQFGLLARRTGLNHYVAVGYEDLVPLGGKVSVKGSTAGPHTVLLSSGVLPILPLNSWFTLRALLDATGRVAVWLYPQGASPGSPVLVGRHADLATGGTWPSGSCGIWDEWTPSSASTREYDNFGAWEPSVDAVLHANQSAEVRTDGTFRETADGVGWAPTQSPPGDLPRLPPSGLEGRPVELFAKWSRDDFDLLFQLAADPGSIRVHYRPCWLFVPSA